ncbi:MAG: aminotransferase class I/II-fold pyridoxal phosphate-dependent enzyme [Kofleriaceae bacterium]
MPGLDFLEDELAALAAVDRLRVERAWDARAGQSVELGGRRLLNFASNDYLGLASDPRLAAAAAAAEQRDGVGAGASRLVSGHGRVAVELERALAAWVGAPAARLFNSGYAANTGLLPVVCGAGDVIFSDERNHASWIDGCRLSRAQVVVYRHGDVDELRRALASTPARRRAVVTESVFSMDGDTVDLAAVAAVTHAAGGFLIVDDAHALGVAGPAGAGLGWAAGADIVVGTLGKSVGAAGAFVAGPVGLAALLWNRARSLVFSTGLTIGTQAAALEGVRIAASTEGDARRSAVRAAARSVRAAVGLAGDGAIIPVIVGADGDAVGAAGALEERGFWIPAIRPPTVAPGTARLRVTLSAGHTAAEVAQLVDVLDDLGLTASA